MLSSVLNLQNADVQTEVSPAVNPPTRYPSKLSMNNGVPCRRELLTAPSVIFSPTDVE